ncbi:MAG: ATP-binding protein [Cyclobacteriaceae bacterium]
MAIFLSNQKLEAEIARRAAETCEHIISEMGAELHDDLIQKLSVLKLYIDRMERASSGQTEIESLSLKIRSEFDQVIHVVRNISRRLLPVKMEGETLDKTIEMLCQNMEHPGTGHIHFENEGLAIALETQEERYLFRIVQELIHNAFKHSSAWHIWVRLKWDANTLVVEVEDDGTGFSKIPEFIERLKRKNNTLKLRSMIIGATLNYSQGQKGLVAKLVLKTKN